MSNTSTSSAVLKAKSVWMDGRLIPWEQANVHVMTHALHYGLGVFEGIRAYKTKDGRLAIFRLQEHVRRFMDSAHIIMLKLPYTEDQLMTACVDLLRAQRAQFAKGAYLRPIAFMGDGAMGLGAVNPTRVAITAAPTAKASMIALEAPSKVEALTKTSKAETTLSVPYTRPGRRTRSATPAARAAAQ